MLFEDYGSIIITGLCDSPKFLINHLRREVKALTTKGFELDEIEHGFREVLTILKNHIQKIYDDDLKVYKRYQKEDESLSKDKRYNYSKPDINQISIRTIKYPSGYLHDLSKLRRTFTLKDFDAVSEALRETLQAVEPEVSQPNHFYHFKQKEPMIYDLELRLPVGRFTVEDEGRKQIKEVLESIEDFEQRLSWYNINVKSLATYPEKGAQIYYEWGDQNESIKVFCNCKDCRSKVDFDKSQEAIYRKSRTNEIERLKAGIIDEKSYKEKLAFLFDTKGFIPDHTPAVWDENATVPIIDLRPVTRAETQVYNQFVIDAFATKYRNSSDFTASYTGFNFKKEKQRLDERLNNPATDKTQLLKYLKSNIEKKFGYPESLNVDKRKKYISNHILQKIDARQEQEGKIQNLFERLCFGETIDLLEVTGLNNHSLLEYTHVSETFKYYQYVKELIETPEKKISHSNELDQSYWIADDFFKNNDWLKSYFNSQPIDKCRIPEIQDNGRTYKIYVPQLYAILSSKNIPFEDNETGTFNGEDFMKDYKRGFEKGEIYFNTEYALPPNILYSNPKAYLENLHLCYYHKAPNEDCGWINWIKTYPFIVTSKEIEQYGFYAGIKYALDQLKEKHSVIFKNFEVSPANNLQAGTQPEQGQPKQSELTPEQLKELIESWNMESDTKPLRRYIENNYLRVRPDDFTLERLKQIKRNIGKWKLILKNKNMATDLQEFITDTISNIDLDIDRYSSDQLLNETAMECGSRPTISAYAIMHVYLAMFKGQPVTKQNKDELIKKYGYNSGAQLRNDFTLYQNEDKRLDLGITNKRAANTHLQRFKDILPLLEKENQQAFNKAKEDFLQLEKTYNKHY